MALVSLGTDGHAFTISCDYCETVVAVAVIVSQAEGRRFLRISPTPRHHPTRDPSTFVCHEHAATKRNKKHARPKAYADVDVLEDRLCFWVLSDRDGKLEVFREATTPHDSYQAAQVTERITADARTAGYRVITSEAWNRYVWSE